jgi:glycosyltransferase involved in cell wall biosynthesis
MNNLRKPQLSLVIPAYNEEDCIVTTIEKTNRVMEDMGLEYEIIVVDDGSIDETGLRIHECTHSNGHLKLVSYPENMGKGYAVKTGFSSAIGDSVVFMDGDMEINPGQIKKYVKALERGDIVVGSKRHPESRVKSPFVRRFLSYSFNVLVRLLTGLKLSDTQSGLKAIKRESLDNVFPVLSVKRFAFDVELLTVANLYGLNIIELPVNIQLKDSNFGPKEIFGMFVDLLGVTYRLKVKKYYHNSAGSSHKQKVTN